MKKTRAAGIFRFSTICLVVLVSMLLFAVGANAVDNTKPTVNGITLSQTSVTAPTEEYDYKTIAVTVDATDDLSGIEEYPTLTFYNKNYPDSELYCSLSSTSAYNPETREQEEYTDGKLHGFIHVDQWTKAGTWTVEYLDIEDLAQNRVYYDVRDEEDSDSTLPASVINTTFTVKNSKLDATAPTVNSITLDQTSVTAADEETITVAVTVDATDDLSGTSYGNVSFINLENGGSVYCSLNLNGAYDQQNQKYVSYNDGKLHGFINVNPWTKPGTYTISYIFLLDEAENQCQYYSNDMPANLSSVSLKVANSKLDTTAPTVNSMTLDQVSITPSGAIAFTVDATDDLSGVDSVYMMVENTTYGNRFNCIFYLNRAYNQITREWTQYDDGKYHAILAMNGWAKPGTYVLYYLNADDQAQNYLYYNKDYPDWSDEVPAEVSNMSFSVVEEPCKTHTYDSGKVTKAATCASEGIMTYTCKVCGATKTEAIPKTTTHTWDAGKTTTRATATTEGVKTYTCTVCGTTKTEAIPVGAIFDDVQDKEKQYFFEPVSWAFENEIVYGTSDTTFSPYADCTRAQVVTFLYRAAGEPDVTGVENPFKDVKSGEYYYDAVLWGYQKGIVYGTSADKFSPNAKVTRAQFITFLHRFAEEPTVTERTSPFKDLPADEYYTDAVLWGYQNGIVYGTSETKFSPENSCTRCQVVTFLYRYMVENQ